jgi:hypothetical protein
MTETWKAVSGYEGLYEVSDLGRVRSRDRAVPHRSLGQITLKGKVLKPYRNRYGYPVVSLSREGRVVRGRAVHRIVLDAFVGSRREGMEACHGDGNKTNNRLSNLRWDTSSENKFDVVRHGTHAMVLRERCPRGHLLDGANLVPSSLKRGRRFCLACNRARSYIKNHGGDLQAVADQKYAEITKEVAA